MGLKADYTPNRTLATKGYIPKDLDGAYRVANRLDGMKPWEVLKAAEEREGT
jgi:hypothetical protein